MPEVPAKPSEPYKKQAANSSYRTTADIIPWSFHERWSLWNWEEIK
jgi:hypothetical protein